MRAQVSSFAVAVLAALPLLASAQVRDGSSFLKACGAAVKQSDGADVSEAEAMGTLYCASYVAGFLDATSLANATAKSQRTVCLPELGITNDQAIRIFVKYLRENPKMLHESGRMSLYTSLATTFPCER